MFGNNIRWEINNERWLNFSQVNKCLRLNVYIWSVGQENFVELFIIFVKVL